MIRAHNLAKWYGGQCIFRALDFHLERAQCLHLRGFNGAGKSTLIKMMAGLCQPSSGTLQVTHQVHLIHARAGLKDPLTVGEHLEFWEALMAGPGTGKAGLAADLWGLQKLWSFPVRALSLGQRKRLQLSQLTLSPAPIWLLDEPHQGLDLSGFETLQDQIRQHLAQDGGVILAHHGDFEKITGAVLNLPQGEVVCSLL